MTDTLGNTPAIHTEVDQVRSGWTMLSALVVREILPSVNTTDGEYTTVNIIRTSLYRVGLLHKIQVGGRMVTDVKSEDTVLSKNSPNTHFWCLGLGLCLEIMRLGLLLTSVVYS